MFSGHYGSQWQWQEFVDWRNLSSALARQLNSSTRRVGPFKSLEGFEMVEQVD